AAVTLTAFFAEAPPAIYRIEAGARRSTLVELHRLEPALPRNEPFGLRVASDRPGVAQATQDEFRAFQRLPEAAGGHVPHPSPPPGRSGTSASGTSPTAPPPTAPATECGSSTSGSTS